jgi:nicotinate-nucleotide pyrophosphorylase (carboxylating)
MIIGQKIDLNDYAPQIDKIIEQAFAEDVGDGDHTSLATIPAGIHQKAQLLLKEQGIIAGLPVAEKVFQKADPEIAFHYLLHDGDQVYKGDIAFVVEGPARSILTAERLALNFLQRMSGIATRTFQISSLIKAYKTTVLDTRKTTPLMRLLEKYAVLMGGGNNHRMGLFDMIMIKDNHVDFAGGIQQAIEATVKYLELHKKSLPIEIEVRSMDELKQVLSIGKVNRIMLDNFTPKQLQKALKIIDGNYETEASGGISLENIVDYAKTGVDFISVGALTHHIKSLDMSLKAIQE